MLKDLQFALRTLARSPGYTIVALITLVLGIGATATVFSLVSGVLLAPLEFAQPDRLVSVREVSGRGNRMQAAWKNFVDWRESSRQFETLAAHTSGGPGTVLGAGQPLRVNVVSVSERFFETLRVDPIAGRALGPQDHRLGAAPASIVSESFWRTYLGGDPDFGAGPLTVGGFETRIVGVVPDRLAFPAGTQVWYPLELDEQSTYRTAHNYRVIGRLRDGTTLEQANAELDAITRRFTEDDPGVTQEEGYESFFPQRTELATLQEFIVGSARRPLVILMAASLLVLLVACTNLASTTLARGTAREQEYAIRHALGAGRRRMMRVILAETLVLSALGAAIGLGLAWAVLRLIAGLSPDGIPRLDQVGLDFRVVGFTVLLSLFAAALAGLMPGIRVSGHAVRSLRSGARGGDDPRRQRIWKGLVACEMALALLLLVGSGLLLRSFWSVLDVEPGYRTAGLLTATVNPPSARYGGNESKRLYYGQLATQLGAIPGVESAGLVSNPPLTSVSNGLVDVDDAPNPTVTADYQVVSPGYFETLGVPVVRGRVFGEDDSESSVHVVVINQALADLAWPGEDPIGKRMSGGGMDDYWQTRDRMTVIGVVADTRQEDLTRQASPTMFVSYRQRPYRAFAMTAILKPRGETLPAGLARAVRETVNDIDSDVPIQFATIEQRFSGALAARRFIMLIIMAFAVCALVLAGVGVYGVVSYAVERRRPEIGIRIALGAQPGSVRNMVQREFMLAAGAGAIAGTVLAIALTRVMTSLLYGVTPTDPLTFVAVIAVLGAAGWVASFIPALRTTRVDPVESMRRG